MEQRWMIPVLWWMIERSMIKSGQQVRAASMLA
jgi:hypothetical protein